MLQVGGGLDLAQKALGADDRGELWLQHLDRDLAIVLEVVGEIDRRHAAGPKFALDAVVVGERGGEAGEGVGHCFAMVSFSSSRKLNTTTTCTAVPDSPRIIKNRWPSGVTS